MNILEKLFEKAKQAASAEEFLTFAKDNNIGLSGETANRIFTDLQCGELFDDELDSINGGSTTYGDISKARGRMGQQASFRGADGFRCSGKVTGIMNFGDGVIYYMIEIPQYLYGMETMPELKLLPEDQIESFFH